MEAILRNFLLHLGCWHWPYIQSQRHTIQRSIGFVDDCIQSYPQSVRPFLLIDAEKLLFVVVQLFSDLVVIRLTLWMGRIDFFSRALEFPWISFKLDLAFQCRCKSWDGNFPIKENWDRNLQSDIIPVVHSLLASAPRVIHGEILFSLIVPIN